ncbi:MAG: hypothetical protein ABIJ08_03990, partial [Nanoarchaeota archaeon]
QEDQIVYRGVSKRFLVERGITSPDEVLEIGLKAKTDSMRDLPLHILEGEDSAFIAASKSKTVAAEFAKGTQNTGGYIFDIKPRAKNAIDIESSFESKWLKGEISQNQWDNIIRAEQEVSIIDGVDPTDIRGYWEVDASGAIKEGSFVPNPNYVDNMGEELIDLVNQGIISEIIDPAKVSPNKLARYIELWDGNPLDETGMHKPINMYKAKDFSVKVSDEFIEGSVVLKKGVKEDWGYDHIFEYVRANGKTRAEEVMEAFPNVKNNEDILDMVQETLEYGTVDPINPLKITKSFEGNSGPKEFAVIMSDSSPGSIQTIRPGS